MQEGGSDGAAEVWATLAPIYAGESEASAESTGGGDVYAKRFECGRAFGGEFVAAVGVGRGSGEPAEGCEAVVERDAEGAGDVIVAGACRTEIGRSVGDEGFTGLAGEDAERFESGSDVRTVEAVVAVLALSEEFDETLGFEAMEMDAGSGRSDFSEHGEFGAGAGAAVHEAVQHAGASRFADGGGDGRGGEIMVFSNIHSLMVNEL
jgi:hypothetical protein